MITATVLKGAGLAQSPEELQEICKAAITNVMTTMPDYAFTTPPLIVEYLELGPDSLRHDLIVAMELNYRESIFVNDGIAAKIKGELNKLLGDSSLDIHLQFNTPNHEALPVVPGAGLPVGDANQVLRDQLGVGKIPAGLGRASLTGVAVGADLDI